VTGGELLVASKTKEPRETSRGSFPYLLTTNHSQLATYFSRTNDIAIPFDLVVHFTEPV
jgi:hypothetical protein